MLQVKITKNLGSFKLQTEFQAENEILGLLGPSGSGKSLTLRAIAGLETPDEGRIVVNNRVLFDSKQKINIQPRQRNIGCVFQNYALFPHLTVAENIAFGLKGFDQKTKKERLQEMLRIIRLEEYANHYPQQLSGGQQQRIALARTLITKPRLLLLDEPFAALDNHVRRHLENELLEIFRNNFIETVLIVTHNVEEVRRLCDRILVYDQGKCVQIGCKQTVIERPATLGAAKVVGCRNLLDVEISKHGDYITAQAGALILKCAGQMPSSVRMIAGFHSYNLHLDEMVRCPINTFLCRVIEVLEGTLFVTVAVDCMGHLIYAELVKNQWYALAKKKGDMLYLHIPPDKVFFVHCQ